jgi:hypothetical protein
MFFEGPTLATVTSTNFTRNLAAVVGSSVALSGVQGNNTLVLSSPSFEPATINQNGTAAGTGRADVYADGQSIATVYIVSPRSDVMIMGPQGNTWAALASNETPLLPPAQGFVQPKVLSGQETWITETHQVRSLFTSYALLKAGHSELDMISRAGAKGSTHS